MLAVRTRVIPQRKSYRAPRLAVLVAVAFALPAGAAESASGLRLAYLDPGSGSFLIQVLIATLAGAAVAVQGYWKKIKGFFGVGDDEPEPREESPGDD